MTDTDCGWSDPLPSVCVRNSLIYVLGISKAKEMSRKAVARYHPLHPDEAVRRQFRQSYGYPIEEADPIYR